MVSACNSLDSVLMALLLWRRTSRRRSTHSNRMLQCGPTTPPGLSFERSVHQHVYGRRGLVRRHETLAELAREVVIRGLGPGLDDATNRVREALLHVEARKRREDAFHLIGRNAVVLESAPVETDTGGGERDLPLFVQRDGGRGGQNDGVPDQPHLAI